MLCQYGQLVLVLCKPSISLLTRHNVLWYAYMTDPSLCRRLKRECAELKEELALLRGGDEAEGEVSEEMMKHLRAKVDEYIAGLHVYVRARARSFACTRARTRRSVCACTLRLHLQDFLT